MSSLYDIIEHANEERIKAVNDFLTEVENSKELRQTFLAVLVERIAETLVK